MTSRRRAQRLEGFVRQQWWRSDPEAALVLPQSREKVRHPRRDELVAVAIKVAGVHPEKDVLNSRQPQRVIYGMFTMVSA